MTPELRKACAGTNDWHFARIWAIFVFVCLGAAFLVIGIAERFQ